MKSINYILIFFLISSIQFLEAQIIPNGNMEDWSTHQLFETPTPFQTGNLQSFILGADYGVTQVSGVTGSAARLETIQAGGDLIPGIIILGELEDDLGGGTPISATPDSVRVSLRYDIPVGDAGAIVLVFSKDGTINGYAQYDVMGTQNSFEQFTFDVPPMVGVPDSVQFVVFSTDPDDPVLGGFVEIDDIILTGIMEEMPNGDFEIWESVEYDEVDNFTSFNPFQALFDLEPMATQTSDAYAGNSAIRIENVEIIDFDNGGLDTLGFIYSGEFLSDYAAFGLDGTPQLISGWYKYAPVENDSATIYLSFTKYNSTIGESEVVAEFNFLLGESSTYIPFEFLLDFNVTPDSFSIAIASGNIDGVDEYVPLGSVLYLDELSFDFIEGTKMPIFSDALEVYPNPAADFVFIKMDEKVGAPKSIQLTDAMGRMIQFSDIENLRIGNELLRIDMRNYSTGMYYYKIETENSVYSGKVMIQR
ncbi:MAG: T9SS type A sorting domain-containing protein [Saprospiraceae bacterium]